jgi:hypothetical protein
MKRYTAEQVTVSNGSKIVTVHSGEPIELVRQGGNLEIGQFNGVNIFNAYYADGTNKPTIELYDPWPHATQTLKSAVVVPTAVHFNTAATVLGETNTKIFQQLASFLDLGTQPTGTVTFKAVGVGDTDLVIKSLPQYKADLDELESFATGSVDTFTLLDEQLNGDGGLVEVSAQIQADLTTSGGTLLGYVNTTEGYMNTALGYRDTAKTYQDNAKSYRDTAYSYHNAVSGWYGTISGWKTAAENARDLAESYMNQAEAFKNAAGEIVGNDFVTLSTEINGKPLTGNIDLDFTDLGMARINRINDPLVHLFAPNAVVKTLNGPLSVVRGSTATYIDRYGVLQTAGVDEIRVNANGALLESGSTNLLPNSTPSLSGSYGTAAFESNAASAPDGTLTASKVSAISGGDLYFVPPDIPHAAGEVHTGSAFFKKGMLNPNAFVRFIGHTNAYGSFVIVVFDPHTNTITGQDAGVLSTGVEILADGWVRIYMTLKTIRDGASAAMYYSIQGMDDGDYALMWGLQQESLPVATSYIPTNGAVASRQPELVSFNVNHNWPSKVKGSATVSLELLLLRGSELIGGSHWFLKAPTESNGYVGGRFIVAANASSPPAFEAITRDGGFIIPRVYSTPDYGSHQHVAVTLDGEASLVKITVDSASAPRSNTFGVWGTFSPNGTVSVGASTTENVGFMYIKNFRIYDVALTEEEVKLL